MALIYTIGTLDLDIPNHEVLAGGSLRQSLHQIATQSPPDIIALNGVCDGVSGVVAARSIRQIETCKHTPIVLFYTNWDSIDRIRAFEAGINETLPLSSHPKEIQLRIDSLLKQSRWPILEARREEYAQVVLLPDKLTCEIDGLQHKLTLKEFQLLQMLLKKQGEKLARERIFQQIWKDDNSKQRVVDTYITKLRKKLGDLGDQIETIHAFGYRFRSS